MAGYTSEKTDVQARLRRIEGQVRGIQRMVEEDKYCIDVLTQLAAAKAGLDGVAMLLLESHVQNCVTDAVRTGKSKQVVDELSSAIKRLVRT